MEVPGTLIAVLYCLLRRCLTLSLCTCFVSNVTSVSMGGVTLVTAKTIGTGMSSESGFVIVTEIGTKATEMKKLRSVIWLTTLSGIKCRSRAF